MITHNQLQEAGFKQFRQKCLWRFTDTGWQLCVRDNEGNKLYFITIAEYDNKEFPGIEQRAGRYSFEPEGQFVSTKGVTFDFTMIGAESIEQVLEFFAELYVKMDCKDYEIV